MHQLQPRTFTRLLSDWRKGDSEALGQLLPMVYGDLHHRAEAYMRHERVGHTLQATALINEVYLRLIQENQLECNDRNDFFAICSNLMRQILVDMARARKAAKRGGGALHVAIDEAPEISSVPGTDLLFLNDALDALERLSPRQARVVTLRYFGGLSQEETAAALGVSVETVKKDWKLAKVWLYREMSQGHPETSNGKKHSK